MVRHKSKDNGFGMVINPENAGAIDANYGKSGGSRTHIKQLNKPKHSKNRVYDINGISPALRTMQGGNSQPKIINFQPRSEDRPSLSEDKNAGGSGILIKENESFTVDTFCNQGVIEDDKIRRLTPIECERLQGFPDGWTKGDSDSQRYKQIGNAITIPVVTGILRKLRKSIWHHL